MRVASIDDLIYGEDYKIVAVPVRGAGCVEGITAFVDKAGRVAVPVRGAGCVKTTACHSISYPLTMHYGIPHGTAVSMLLGPVFRLNASALNRQTPLLTALGVSSPDELEERIRDLLHRSGQPATLEEWGVPRKDLPHLAQLGITKGRADNNPVPIDPATILSILERIYRTKPYDLNRKGA